MMLVQTIHQHVMNFPLERQAEILDFVLFLEQKLNLSAPPHEARTAVPPDQLAINRLFGSYADSLSSSEEFARCKLQEIEREEAKWQRK
ncbi:MAG: hypothetical protein GY862_21700 [Gammaproteobacteria bacterium]|nr:hypothetical protein [Gammaproteobacteria bacterium]